MDQTLGNAASGGQVDNSTCAIPQNQAQTIGTTTNTIISPSKPSLVSQDYDSDEDDVETQFEEMKNQPLHLKEVLFPTEEGYPAGVNLSGDESSEMEAMSDADDDDDSGDEEGFTLTGDHEKDRAFFEGLMGDNDDEGAYKTKNELSEKDIVVEPLAPLESAACKNVLKAGHVLSVFERTFVVQTTADMLSDSEDEEVNTDSNEPTCEQALDIGSCLYLRNGTPLGYVEDVFGTIDTPFYNVRHAQSTTTKEGESIALKSLLKQRDAVYFNPAQTKFVLPSQCKAPATDASNLYDEEVSEDQMEFSDDEAEMKYKQEKKKKLKAKKDQDGSNAKTDNKSKPQKQQQPRPQHQHQHHQQQPHMYQQGPPQWGMYPPPGFGGYPQPHMQGYHGYPNNMYPPQYPPQQGQIPHPYPHPHYGPPVPHPQPPQQGNHPQMPPFYPNR